MDDDLVLQEMFSRMADHYQPGQFSSETWFYFKLGDDSDRKWTVCCRSDEVSVEQGKHVEKADCVLSTSSDFFLKMFRENYTPGMMDFMKGRIKTNAPQLLLKFKESFEVPDNLRDAAG